MEPTFFDRLDRLDRPFLPHLSPLTRGLIVVACAGAALALGLWLGHTYPTFFLELHEGLSL